MAQYVYNDAEMSAIIDAFANSRQSFILVRDSVSQALNVLRSVNAAGGDLSSAVDGTVLANVSNVLNRTDAELNGMTRRLELLRDAQAILRKDGAQFVNSESSAAADVFKPQTKANVGFTYDQEQISRLIQDMGSILD